MRKHIALGSVLAVGLAGQALATESFSYSNIEVSYVKTEIDDFDVDGDGFKLGGSFEFTENFFGFASYQDIDYDLDVNGKQTTVGVGFAWPLSSTLDVTGGLSYEDFEVDLDGGEGSFSDDGFGLAVGLRGKFTETLEWTGAVKYTDLGGGSDDTTFSVGGRYYFTPAFAAGIDLGTNDDGTTWGIVARYDFGG
jgi:outer membrane autotransporter protein